MSGRIGASFAFIYLTSTLNGLNVDVIATWYTSPVLTRPIAVKACNVLSRLRPRTPPERSSASDTAESAQ